MLKALSGSIFYFVTAIYFEVLVGVAPKLSVKKCLEQGKGGNEKTTSCHIG